MKYSFQCKYFLNSTSYPGTALISFGYDFNFSVLFTAKHFRFYKIVFIQQLLCLALKEYRYFLIACTNW